VLIAPEYRRREAVLVAFGGKDGSPAGEKSTREETTAITAELQRMGLTKVTVEDLGQILPVAPEDTPEGREKNRRIEIWVMR
jgi:phosphate transport system substrate-binding protein